MTLLEAKTKTARELIRGHYDNDRQMRMARLFLSPRDHVIRILELTEAVPSSENLTPFSFDKAPDMGIDFPSSVILVNEADWQRALTGILSLPKGWNLKTSVEVPKECQ